MKVVIVYESLFGNTKVIADCIASGFPVDCDVEISAVGDATVDLTAGADLLVLGAPTHAHGLSRAGTRNQTLRNGVLPEIARGPGMREFLTTLPPGGGRPAAAFDTRLRGPRWLWGAASSKIAAALVSAGYRLVEPGASFRVTGSSGPLVKGEVERAAQWTQRLAEACSEGLRTAA